jgi:hypothetical protein
MNIKLFQLCYKKEMIDNVKDGFIPWDNTINLNPELREYPIFKKVYNDVNNDLKYWGVVSNKFTEKTNITGFDFIKWIENLPFNEDANCYFINPCPIMECLFYNVVNHGEYWHKGIGNLMQRTLTVMGYTSDLATMLTESNRFSMCNYFVGDKYFWSNYLSFVDEFLRVIDKNSHDKELMYCQSAEYNRDKTLAFYPFVIERLFSVFLCLKAYSMHVKNYEYSIEELIKKYNITEHQAREIKALSAIKSAIRTNGNLKPHWEFLRNKFLIENKEIFGKE